MLATILLAALSGATPAVQPGTYEYTATYQGVQSGRSTVTARRDGDTTTIQESANGAINDVQVAAAVTLTLDTDLIPTIYNGSYDSGAAHAVITVTVGKTVATLTGTTTYGMPLTFPLKPPARHFVIIEPGLMAGLFGLPAQMQAWQYDPILAIAPSVAKSENFELDTTAKPQRPDGVPAQDTQITFGGQLAFTIWYDPATYVPDAVVVPSQNAVLTRVRK
ncbi:MAG TPA: hypothetical protein VFE36_03850 [Candidatus Baltobacteraceae bacterium]|jgi:hypothetical protein|nr:hypothetical protein [Candidatus Baltobacteraceae bacterium]